MHTTQAKQCRWYTKSWARRTTCVGGMPSWHAAHLVPKRLQDAQAQSAALSPRAGLGAWPGGAGTGQRSSSLARGKSLRHHWHCLVGLNRRSGATWGSLQPQSLAGPASSWGNQRLKGTGWPTGRRREEGGRRSRAGCWTLCPLSWESLGPANGADRDLNSKTLNPQPGGPRCPDLHIKLSRWKREMGPGEEGVSLAAFRKFGFFNCCFCGLWSKSLPPPSSC